MPSRAAPAPPAPRRALARELLWAAFALQVGFTFAFLDFGQVNAIPAGASVVPAMALALVARPWVVVATGAISVTTVVTVYFLSGLGGWGSLGRILAGVLGVVVAGLLSSVRLSREREAVTQAEAGAALRSEATIGRWLGLALERSGLGAWEWHVGSRDLVTRGMAPLLGLPSEAAVTAPAWLGLLAEPAREDWTARVRSSLLEGTPLHDVHELTLLGGEQRWLEVRAEARLDEHGAVTGLVGTAVDVTARRLAEDDARALQQVVEAMLAVIPHLASAPDERTLWAEVCRRSRLVFGTDSASVWWLAENGDGSATLVARSPEEPGRWGERVPLAAVLDSAPTLEMLRAQVLRRHEVRPFTPVAPNGPKVAVITPLRAAGTPFAYLSLTWDDDRPDPSAEWLAVVDRFATRVVLARAIVLARQAESEVAELSVRLQQGLAPTRLPVDGGGSLQVATLYRPGERRLRLGGDFLDCWPLDDGRVAFVLGDVCGHGPEQAALGVMLRSAWTGAVSADSSDPAAWVRVLAGVLESRRTDPGVFATVVTGVLDPADGLLRIVCAGHPDPICVGEGGARPLALDPQLAIGILETADYRVDKVRLDPGDGLLLFSDGLFEDRGEGPMAMTGYDLLLVELAAVPPRTDEDLEHLLLRLDQRHRTTGDDVTALLLRP